MARTRSYSDDALRHAIKVSTSWRGTLRALNLPSTSASMIRSVRARAEALDLDISHFRGQQRWTRERLELAIAGANDWSHLFAALGVSESSRAMVEGHAVRLGLDVGHLAIEHAESATRTRAPAIAHLDRAGPLLAASWLTLTGHNVSWPLEPCRYDLLAELHGSIRRIQVKTTTARAGDSWKVYLSTTSGGRRVYSPEEIDDFFIIDGALACYLVPLQDVGGLQAIHLSRYQRFRLAPLMSAAHVAPTS